MTRFAIILILLVVALSLPLDAQWTHTGVWPRIGTDTIHFNGVHGLAVSPDGAVWVLANGAYARDTIRIRDTLRAVRAVYAHNPDGTHRPFSPIIYATINSVTEPIGARTSAFGGFLANTGVGMRAERNGNILAVLSWTVFRFNYQTGAGMMKLVIDNQPTTNWTGTSPGVDDFGNFYYRTVFGGNPLRQYSQAGTLTQNVADTAAGFSRTIIASHDANDIYNFGYTLHGAVKYSSSFGEFGPWTTIDTVLKGFACESVAWQPGTGWLWASAGSMNDMPNRYPGVTTAYTPGTWYGVDVATGQVKDSIKWVPFTGTLVATERPRAIAFSPTGDTAYVGIFGGSERVGLRRFIKTSTSVKRDDNLVAENFRLEQNYPNPFNPNTNIRFELKSAGFTTLKVYDMVGREVATLVNESLNAGVYTASFKASNLPSGIYLYKLTSGNSSVTKKMTLMK